MCVHRKALHEYSFLASRSCTMSCHCTEAWSIAVALFSKVSLKARATSVGYCATWVSVECHTVWSSWTHFNNTIKKYSGDHNNNNNIIISLNFFDVHMHSVFPSPASPTYPLRHGPHVCSGVDKEHSSRPIELQSGTSVQSKAEISHELMQIISIYVV